MSAWTGGGPLEAAQAVGVAQADGLAVAMTAALAVVATVLAVSGVAKVLRPAGFAGLLRTLGLPGGTAAARAVGVGEVVLGGAVVVLGSRPLAAGLAVLYVVLAATVVVARRRGASSCGCFGAVAAPPSTVHVAVNLVSAGVAAAAAMAGPVPVADLRAGSPLGGAVLVALVAAASWLVVVVDTAGAEVADLVGRVAALGPTFRAQSEHAGHRHDPPASQRSGRATAARARRELLGTGV